jgi:hypothetical protein
MKFSHLHKLISAMAFAAGLAFLAGSIPESVQAQGSGGSVASPSIVAVTFDPATPATGDRLRAVVQAGTADLSGLRFQWKVNGEMVQSSTEDTLSHPFKRGDFIELDAIANDGVMRSNSVFVGNAPPTVQLKSQQIDGSGTYTAQMETADPDSDPVTLILKNGPQGMEIDQASKAIKWKVPADAKGVYGIEVSARDPQGDESMLSFQVKIGWETGGKADTNAASSNSPKQ